jgi:hypothetical protein
MPLAINRSIGSKKFLRRSQLKRALVQSDESERWRVVPYRTVGGGTELTRLVSATFCATRFFG